ncbi:AraC family transcriptional regulator [Bacteroides sp. 224]|uniref:AraC family transcriptional regulator n=1 Tax=Bacteroides sp. 224 TaxID=2302936 RepID=UPI0013D323EF|nr:AraC family transcriptional regulator [Bacteroides sp. 224]NDV64711.1 AraC family transcriptional regulator [Bacteroides sp. 224]
MKKIINEQLPISKSSPLKARFYHYKRFTYPWHFHPEYEIIYVKTGTGTRFIGNSIERYTDGDILLTGPNLPHCMKSDEAYSADDCLLSVKGTIIQFEKDFMQHAINHYPHFIKIKTLFEESQRGVFFPSPHSSKLKALLDSIPQEKGIDQITSFLQLLKLMSETNSRQIISTSDYTYHIPFDVSRIDKIIAYLNKHYTRRIDLEEISSFAAMNPTAFCRFFKGKTGKSFKNYILDMRIDYACKLLLMEDTNISQVSIECGFETITYFNKVFKEQTGQTPTEYKVRKRSSEI